MWLWQPPPNDAKCYSTSMYWLRMLKEVTTWMSLLISDLLTSRTVKHIIYQKLIWKNPSSRKSIENPYEIHRKLIKLHALCTKSVPQIPRSAEVATSSFFDAISMGTFTRISPWANDQQVDMVTDIYIYI